MATKSGCREERRRKISERGPDRMALITRRMLSFPSSSASVTSPSNRHPSQESLSSDFDSDNHPDDIGGAEGQHDSFVPTTQPKHQAGISRNCFSSKSFSTKNDVETLIQNLYYNREANPTVVDDDIKANSSLATLGVQKEAYGMRQLPQAGSHKPTFFSSRELNSSILASETIRAFSALMMALLVLLTDIATTKPLYIVLLTDVTIVISRMHHGKGRDLEEEDVDRAVFCEARHNWSHAVKLMERGLVVYQAIRGVFIDCSVFLVVVVCGISFM